MKENRGLLNLWVIMCLIEQLFFFNVVLCFKVIFIQKLDYVADLTTCINEASLKVYNFF